MGRMKAGDSNTGVICTDVPAYGGVEVRLHSLTSAVGVKRSA
jgi:hypothetical protein